MNKGKRVFFAGNVCPEGQEDTASLARKLLSGETTLECTIGSVGEQNLKAELTGARAQIKTLESENAQTRLLLQEIIEAAKSNECGLRSAISFSELVLNRKSSEIEALEKEAIDFKKQISDLAAAIKRAEKSDKIALQLSAKLKVVGDEMQKQQELFKKLKKILENVLKSSSGSIADNKLRSAIVEALRLIPTPRNGNSHCGDGDG